LPECALLAGLPKGPERFSPFRHPERAFRRRNIVLQRMKEEEFITEHDLLTIHGNQPFHFKRKPVEKVNAAYFIETVRIQLEPKYGADTLYQRRPLDLHDDGPAHAKSRGGNHPKTLGRVR
jgi:penicillin-binding protein 1A